MYILAAAQHGVHTSIQHAKRAWRDTMAIGNEAGEAGQQMKSHMREPGSDDC